MINDISLFIVIVIIYAGRRNGQWIDADEADEGGRREVPDS